MLFTELLFFARLVRLCRACRSCLVHDAHYLPSWCNLTEEVFFEWNCNSVNGRQKFEVGVNKLKERCTPFLAQVVVLQSTLHQNFLSLFPSQVTDPPFLLFSTRNSVQALHKLKVSLHLFFLLSLLLPIHAPSPSPFFSLLSCVVALRNFLPCSSDWCACVSCSWAILGFHVDVCYRINAYQTRIVCMIL